MFCTFANTTNTNAEMPIISAGLIMKNVRYNLFQQFRSFDDFFGTAINHENGSTLVE